MKKRLISIAMACCMLLSFLPMSISAVQQEPISPRWTNTNSVTAFLDFTGSTGYVTVAIMGDTGVSNITAEIKLYVKNTAGTWTDLNVDWTYDVDQQYLSVGETFTGVAGLEYMMVLNATVTKDGYGEPISKSSTDVCPTTTP